MEVKNRARPIKPTEVCKKKEDGFPDAVFESFNELITKNFFNGYAVVFQNDVVALMIKKGLKRGQIFDNGWLNVEHAYELAGWKVLYNKPGFNEDYVSSFEFTFKK